MAKRAFRNKDLLDKEPLPDLEGEEMELGPLEPPNRISAFFSGIYGKMFGIIKFVLGVCFLPFVYAASAAFLREFMKVEYTFGDYFWLGGIAFVLIYFFVWEPGVVYSKGQRLLEFIFNFFKPLVKVAPYVLPVYAIVIFAIYKIFSSFISSLWFLRYSLFFLGMSMALHIVYSGKTLRSKKNDFLKGNYIFGFSFIYIMDVILLSLFMSLIFEKFSFVDFFSAAFASAQTIFVSVFRQLFVPAA